MKRYVIEMSNDFEKRVKAEQKIEVIKIHNAYINGLMTEIDAIKALLKLVEDSEK